MAIENENVRKPPPWAAAVKRDGFLPAAEAGAILVAMGEDIQVPDGQARISWDDRERLLQARKDMTWLDVHTQFPYEYPVRQGRISDPEIQRAFHARAWLGEDLEVAKTVLVPPNSLEPTAIPVILNPANLPMGLDYPQSQLSEEFGIVHLGTRSRYAQAGLEITNCLVTDEMYEKLQRGEKTISTAQGFNYGNRPYFLEAGTHPGGYFSYEGIPRLVGFDLVKAMDRASIEVKGKIGEDWDFIFHTSWPRNYLHIVGVRVKVGNWQMLRQHDDSGSVFSIRDRGSGYRQEIATLYETADFSRLLPGTRIQHGPFMNVSDYREYLITDGCI